MTLFPMMPLGMAADSPEARQAFVDELNRRGGFVWWLKSGREGMSIVDMDEARARIEAKRERRQAGRTNG